MNDDALVTRREMNLTIKNLSLEITNSISVMFDAKFEDLERRWDTISEERYREHVMELSGEPPENSEKIREGIQHAMKSAASQSQTNSEVKKAVIGVGTTFSLGGAITWLVSHFQSTPGN